MISLENAEYLNGVVQEIAHTAPEDWKKIVYYHELLPHPDGYLRNKRTAACWHGTDMREYTSGFEIGSSVKASNAIKAYYEDSKDRGRAWTALLLIINEDGNFKTQFFYDSTPLLDEKYDEVDKIMNSAG